MRSYRTLVFWQASAYAAEDGVLTETMVDDIVIDALRAHEKKVLWQQDHEAGDYLTPLRSSKDASTFVPPSATSTSASAT